MPRQCECPRCVKFRSKDENQPQITQAVFLALQKVNNPSTKSRRARIEAGVGKSGQIGN